MMGSPECETVQRPKMKGADRQAVYDSPMPHTGSSLMDSTTRQTTRLRIVTPDPSSRPDEPSVIGPSVVLDCEGGYTCECSGCRSERALLVKRGVRPRQRAA
jgi:hypothetical protein